MRPTRRNRRAAVVDAQLMARVRLLLARRPWIRWCAIVVLAAGLATGVHGRLREVAAARDAWGSTTEIWVAAAGADVGEPLAVERRTVPIAFVPPDAVTDDPTGSAARQRIGPDEVVTTADVLRADDPLALAPAGWLVAPVEERPPSGAGPGDRVQVVAAGFVLASEATVIDTGDGVTLVAVPAELAPLLPAAADAGPVTLLRVP